MGKTDFLRLKPPARPRETRTFSDPDQAGVELELTLSPADVMAAARAEEIAEDLFARWGDDPDADNPAFPLEGNTERLPRRFCQSVANVYASQSGPEPYSADELCAAALVMPRAWLDACEWLRDLNQEARPDPKASAARAEPASCAPPSATTSDTPA